MAKEMFRSSSKTHPRYCVHCAPSLKMPHYHNDHRFQRGDPEFEFWGFCDEHGRETGWHKSEFFTSSDQLSERRAESVERRAGTAYSEAKDFATASFRLG